MQNSEINTKSLAVVKTYLKEKGLKDTKKAAIICAIDLAADFIKYEKITENLTENKNIKYPEDIIDLNGKMAIVFGIIGFILFVFSVYLFFTS